eukprot:6203219-Pleurochrysis_carterae.AAC.2
MLKRALSGTLSVRALASKRTAHAREADVPIHESVDLRAFMNGLGKDEQITIDAATLFRHLAGRPAMSIRTLLISLLHVVQTCMLLVTQPSFLEDEWAKVPVMGRGRAEGAIQRAIRAMSLKSGNQGRQLIHNVT